MAINFDFNTNYIKEIIQDSRAKKTVNPDEQVNWKREWERCTGRQINKCMIFGCGDDAKYVDHFLINRRSSNNVYVAPTCKNHHKSCKHCQKEDCIDCYYQDVKTNMAYLKYSINDYIMGLTTIKPSEPVQPKPKPKPKPSKVMILPHKPKFDGNSNENYSDWESEIKIYINQIEGSDKDKVNLIFTCLGGNAREVVRGFEGKINLNELFKKLRDIFGKKGYTYDDIAKCVQGSDNVRIYTGRLESIATSLNQKDDGFLKYHFEKGLSFSLKNRLNGLPLTTYKEAKEAAIKLEIQN